ncbi:HTH_Tnp_Tc3_2 domain-containing protein [Trichonephila clavipes]|nr:HTH_Tnp_Tc3_2 domain-containing protein [Trichonephila clavipes]
MIQKIDNGHSPDYVACKRSLECLFGLDALRKIKILSKVSHRQSSGAFLWGENWASKLFAVIGIRLIWCHTKKRYQLLGNVLRLQSVAAGGYYFAFRVTRITFAFSKIDITPRKRSKIIVPNEHTSMTVKNVATVVGLSKSSVSRILRTFQGSGTSFLKRKGKCGSKRKTTPGTDKILIRNCKINPRETSKDLRKDLLEYNVEVNTSIVRKSFWKLVIRDEAHFWLNGYVNKQNCRIWSEANPQVYVETPLHPEKLTVWCSLWAGGILLQKR